MDAYWGKEGIGHLHHVKSIQCHLTVGIFSKPIKAMNIRITVILLMFYNHFLMDLSKSMICR